MNVPLESRGNEPASVIGRELANKLRFSDGKVVEVTFLGAENQPYTGEVSVDRIKDTGIYESNSTLLQVSEPVFHASFGDIGLAPNTFWLSLKDPFEARSTANTISGRLGDEFVVVDWISANNPLFTALKFERRIANIVFGLMILISALGVSATVALLVDERKTDIAVLKTSGATSRSLAMIFLVEGLIIGITGVFFGSLLGWAACILAEWTGFTAVPAEVYSVKMIELSPDPLSVLVIASGTILVVLAAILIPVIRAARQKVNETIRSV